MFASSFSEVTDPKIAEDGIRKLDRLADDNYEAMRIALLIIHSKNNSVLKQLPEDILLEMAILCDYIDVREALGLWPEQWFKQFSMDATSLSKPDLLFLTSTFRQQDLFRQCLRDVVLHCSLEEASSAQNAPETLNLDTINRSRLPQKLIGAKRRLH